MYPLVILLALCAEEGSVAQAPSYVRSQDKGVLSLEDIKQMSQAGMSDDKIIQTIHKTESTYNLTPNEIQDLKIAGVSQRVIDYMTQTAYN